MDWKVLALCALVAILVMERLWLITRRAAKVERLVQERTQELSRSNAQLEIERKRLEKMKDEFISAVSHEMRTPLSITKEGISLVLDRIPGEINPEQDAILTMARRNIDRLARIINDLLDISNLEAGRVHLRRERAEIGDLFRQVVEAFQPRASAKALSLRVSVPEQGVPIYADADKVMEILTNLVDNAVKFTDAGRITLLARADRERVECSVEDTGVGISAQDLPRVFGKFEQFGRLSGAGAQGTGLGLAIAKRLVELHHGTLRVESQPKKGTRFIFTLPSYSPGNVLQGMVGDKVHEAAVKGTKLSLFWVTVGSADSSDREELENLLKRRVCRREDQLFRMPDGLVLLVAGCDRDAAAKVQVRCDRLLRAALDRKGQSAGIPIRCAAATFPDEAKTAEELLAKMEERCKQLGGQGGKDDRLKMRARARGFTLVEMMIAVLLLVGGVAAATFMFGRGIGATMDTENVDQGVALAQEKMENLRGTAFAAVASEAKAAVSGWTEFSRDVVVSQPAGTNTDFKQVVVTVYWQTTTGEVSTALTSYVANVLNN